ncbi:MAG TPA: glycolate oxidase subunit GlcE [Gammaproteobacteria bacterium]|nr:glycolate oxidase subunit GlcE [Gammaproteobacteria bacterium]
MEGSCRARISPAFNVEAYDHSEALLSAVQEAYAYCRALKIRGGDTKAFYGRAIDGESLNVSPHRGVVNYEPTELVITARAGTKLSEIETLLSEQGQMFPFEPPHFGVAATVGGCVAAGLAGPRRPFAGAVRDNLLGVEVINGRGERLKFGGEVMKNVAGYDLSRLMAGALGTLGVLLQCSIKVLPRPLRALTLAQTVTAKRAIQTMNEWARRPLPISATWHDGKTLYARLEGGEHAVEAAAKDVGGDRFQDGEALWRGVREQAEPFFCDERPLWRVSVPPATPVLHVSGDCTMEWNGALRWIKTNANAKDIHHIAAEAGGHATLFRGGNRRGQVFQPLPAVLMAVHKNLKKALDPASIFNPGRLYPEL